MDKVKNCFYLTFVVAAVAVSSFAGKFISVLTSFLNISCARYCSGKYRQVMLVARRCGSKP